MSAPTEQHSPHSPTDLDTVFLLSTSLNADCAAPHTLGQIGYFIYFIFHTLFTGTFCPCATSLSSHSAISLLHLSPHGPFPFSLPYFLFCLLNNYVLINWGSSRSWERCHWQGWRPRWGYCSFIDKSGCLSAFLPGPEEHPRGAACWWVSSHPAGKWKSGEWEWLKEGRKDAALCFYSTWRGRESEVSTGHFFQIPSPQRERLDCCALQQTRERGTLLRLILLF